MRDMWKKLKSLFREPTLEELDAMYGPSILVDFTIYRTNATVLPPLPIPALLHLNSIGVVSDEECDQQVLSESNRPTPYGQTNQGHGEM